MLAWYGMAGCPHHPQHHHEPSSKSDLGTGRARCHQLNVAVLLLHVVLEVASGLDVVCDTAHSHSPLILLSTFPIVSWKVGWRRGPPTRGSPSGKLLSAWVILALGWGAWQVGG